MNAAVQNPQLVDAAPLTAAQLAAEFPQGRVPKRPCLIPTLPEAPLVFPSLAHLAEALARRLEGKVPILIRGMGTYPGYDTFPVFSVHGMNPRGLQGRPCTGTYLCSVAVQDVTADVLDEAIAAAQARLMGGEP